MNIRSSPLVALLFAFVLTFGDYWILVAHYFGEFDGVVVSRTEIHLSYLMQATRYVLREADGHNYIYMADPSEGGGFSGFPIGTRLSKQTRHLDYQADGVTRNDFPLGIYFFWATFNSVLILLIVLIGIAMRIRDRRRARDNIYDRIIRSETN